MSDLDPTKYPFDPYAENHRLDITFRLADIMTDIFKAYSTEISDVIIDDAILIASYESRGFTND